MKKKLLSLMMACVMVLTLAIPAFAEDYYNFEGTESNELTQPLTFEARTFVPTVSLSIPNFGDNPVVLNPYKIEYKGSDNLLSGQEIKGTGTPLASTDWAKQVISPIYAIENKTDVKLNYSVVAKAVAEGAAQVVGDYVSLTEQAKKVHVNLILAQRSNAAKPAMANNTAGIVDLDGKAAGYESITLKPNGADSKSNDDIKFLEPGNTSANYLWFQFQGDLSRQPKEGWTADDKVTFSLVFTFTPESKADFEVTYTNASMTAADATSAVTQTIAATGGDLNATGITFADSPSWSVISTSVAGAAIATASGTHTLTIPVDFLKSVPKDDTLHTYVSVFGFNDKNGVPRTLQVTYKLTRAST